MPTNLSLKTTFKLNSFIALCCSFVLFHNCAKDESNPINTEITTVSDTFFVSQNSSDNVLSIFNNDNNIPTSGTLSIDNPALGQIIILDENNTENNPSDDIVIYNPNPNTIGEDIFSYTICNADNDCKTETVTVTISSLNEVTPFTNNTPHNTLSEYNFFSGDLKDLNPTFGVLPYTLISTLFTDYAKKKRFIWMPNGESASYVNDYETLNFPVGTYIIKNFYYDNVIPNNATVLIETRLMFKTNDGWDFANYIWNDEQSEAFLSYDPGTKEINWTENGVSKYVNYQIPSASQCFTCHNTDTEPVPIGPKPQNLNRLYNYDGELQNQLSKLINFGYLNDFPIDNIDSVVDWTDESEDINLRARSYIDINCAHCHIDGGHCNYRSVRFSYRDNGDTRNMGICEIPETQFIPNSNIIKPNNLSESILHFRLNTTDESLRMPLFGRTLIHEEGLEMIEDWILSLNDCN